MRILQVAPPWFPVPPPRYGGTELVVAGLTEGLGAAGHDVCFIHPKGNDEFPLSGRGVLIELVQAPPEVIEAFAKLAA